MSDSTDSSDAAEVIFRRMEPTENDLLLFKRCFDSNGSPRSLELLRWQYLEPPAGRLYVDLAVVQGEQPRLAAVYAAFPVFMRANGVRTCGIQSLDTLTDVAFRGKGLFIRMAAALYNRCQAEGVGLVYGFPNGNSAPGFFKRLNWRSLDPLPGLFKPLRSSYLLQKLRFPAAISRLVDIPLTWRSQPRLAPNQELRRPVTFGPEFDTLWSSFSRGILWSVERDAAYLRWRLSRPDQVYEVIGLYEDGQLVGWVAIGMARGSESPAGKLMDVVYDPTRPELGTALLAAAVRRLYHAGCPVIWAVNFEFSPNHRPFRNAGFLRVPAWLRQEVHVGARSLAVPADGIGERRNWYLSLLDSDTE